MIRRPRRCYEDFARTYIDSDNLSFWLFPSEKHDTGQLPALHEIRQAGEIFMSIQHPKPIKVDLCQRDTKPALGGHEELAAGRPRGSLIREGIGEI
jgi:hypothetical protein